MNAELPETAPSGILIFRAFSETATATERIVLTR
jgi:hypothetical protein